MIPGTTDPRGAITQSGTFLRVDNALVEEVSHTGRNTGYLIFSYTVPRPGGMVSIERFRLNVSSSTIVLNSRGLPMCLCDIRQGTWINAMFSPAVSRSIPPQSTAFWIMVQRGGANISPNPPNQSVTTDRVVAVEPSNNFLYTGIPGNPNRQMRFVITNQTVILDRNGSRILLRALRPGQMVRVTHANFQTASIPPQTTAFQVQVL